MPDSAEESKEIYVDSTQDQDEDFYEGNLFSLLNSLASPALDASTPKTRQDLLKEAIRIVATEDKVCESIVFQNWTLDAALKCGSSVHASKRTLTLLASALSATVKRFEILPEDVLDVDGKHFDVLEGICVTICKVLVKFSSFQSETSFEPNIKTNRKSKGIILMEKCQSILDSLSSAETEIITCTFLHKIVLSDKYKHSGEYAPALSFISLLSVDCTHERLCCESFISYALAGGKDGFGPASVINLASLFLQSLTADLFNSNLAPSMGLKLRANPEGAIKTVNAIIHSLIGVYTINMASHMIDGEDCSSAVLLPTIIKLLKSTKSTIRELATATLKELANGSNSCNKNGTAEIVVAAVCRTLNGEKVKGATLATTLTQPEHKEAAFKVLKGVAYEILRDLERSLLENDNVVVENITDISLNCIVGILMKGVTGDARNACIESLVAMMVLAKRAGAISSKGYQKSMEYFSTSLVTTSKVVTSSFLNDFRFCIGSLLTYASFHGIHIIESILLGAINQKDQSKIISCLTSIVDSAVKKHSNSALVPQVDGLIAVYLVLLYTLETNKTLSSLPASIIKALNSGSSTSCNEASFLFSDSMINACASDPIIGQTLHVTISLLCTLIGKEEQDSVSSLSKYPICLNKDGCSVAAHAFASCIANPFPNDTIYRPFSLKNQPVLHTINSILTYAPSKANVSNAIINALFLYVNDLSNKYLDGIKSMNACRESRECYHPCNQSPPTPSEIFKGPKDKKINGGSHSNFDSVSIRRVANILVKTITDLDRLVEAIILAHIGTTVKVSGKIQRIGLVKNLESIVADIIIPLTTKEDAGMVKLSRSIVHSCTSHTLFNYDDKSSITHPRKKSPALQEASLGLLSTLVQLAGYFDPCYDDATEISMLPYKFSRSLCIDYIAKEISSSFTKYLEEVEKLDSYDCELHVTPPGTKYSPRDCLHVNSSNSSDLKQRNKNRKGISIEDEEWERQVKKELAEKKSVKDAENNQHASSSGHIFTEEDKKIVKEQDEKRRKLSNLLEHDFCMSLMVIEVLCLSDVEVGNSALSIVFTPVLAASVSACQALVSLPYLKDKAFSALVYLSSCVYEIDELHSHTIANALCLSCASTKEPANFTVRALPSPCTFAATTIFEIMDYGECLSPNSFAFLFPILRAAITGPRTVPGCEGALKIINMHADLIVGENANSVVVCLRKEIANALLELLCHDRSKTFKDPSPIQTLIRFYTYDDDISRKPNTSDLSPLLGDFGALGSVNCRLAAMMTLGSIADKHPKIIKSNPLIENRLWVNCFAEEDNIKAEARNAWNAANDLSISVKDTILPPPSKLFAIPLLPLISHSNPAISNAAAKAFGYAMQQQYDTIDKNLIRLCNSYIDSYPTKFEDKGENFLPKTTAIAVVEKKSVSKISAKNAKLLTGLPPKKKKSGKPVSAISAITANKKKPSGKMKKINAVLTPKKPAVPTFDKSALEAQFQTSSKSNNELEIDNARKISVRCGVLQVITEFTKVRSDLEFKLPTLKLLSGFLMAYGLADGNERVRALARNTIRDVVTSGGSSDDAIVYLLPLFENALSSGNVDISCIELLKTEKILSNIAASDYRKEGAVIALGSAAIHLKDEEEDKISETIDMLLKTLGTPSESVQSSVALCLTKLMKKGKTQERVGTILSNLVQDCLTGNGLAIRRGAAYGIAAVVKGSGIVSLKKYEIVKQLEEACVSGSSTSKEGALYAIELLSDRLGLLFEPYVIVLLPSLLNAFSDGSNHVRSAANTTVGVIMSKLSGHGVKLLMPSVLSGLESDDWRTKQASIHMLGAMSHCAPKQLASCLPNVVPRLTEAFSDTHPKVKLSAEESLNEICRVIRNPEVSEISNILLKALTDPTNGTLQALERLIEMEFVHAIDAPSLALIIPVLHRGLRDRAATTKRYGALISGNICTMVDDPRDFVPYLPTLLPDLKSVLLDPIPDCRKTSAQALGSLTRSLGEATFPELRPWLINILTGENEGSVERSGAAQGLTEVLCASGIGLVETVMRTEILPLKSHPKSSTREGVLWVLAYLPLSLGQEFAPLIDVSFPVLISGLSDDSDAVREVAMNAGKVMIRLHGKVYVDKILPSLEKGLGDSDDRIRVASLMLLGNLLLTIGGTKRAKGDGDTQEDIRQAEKAQAQISRVLGPQKKKRVLSSLYLRRSDSTAVVRQNAVQVWKTVVSVTPKTLREILDVLVELIVTSLASGHSDHTQVAGRCLGDIVRKLGDAVLPEIIPVLRDALYRGDEHTRLGAVVGLKEVIACCSKEQMGKYIDIIVKAVKDALCDKENNIRETAASCFQTLYSVTGNQALDEIVPVLLVLMESSDGDESTRMGAINGLTAILSIRSKELLPYLVPRLLRRPISTNQASALGSICSVTSGTIHMFFSTIIPTLLNELSLCCTNELDGEEKEREEGIRYCVSTICGTVETIGINVLISEIAKKCSSDKESLRKEGCWMLETVVEQRKSIEDFYDVIPIMYRELLNRQNDESKNVLKFANRALLALSKNVPAEELVKNVEFIRNLIASIVSDARRRKGGVGDGEFLLPGFNTAKGGLEALLPIYQRGILYGSSTIREVSAAGLGELITLTSNKFLAGPLIIKMTGPLLRIVGDRNPSAVKVAIIQTLGLVLSKGGMTLRAFVPQFQTTFVKALSDPSRQVRIEAIKAIALLMPLSTRVDPLIKELVSTSSGKTASVSLESAGVVAIQTAALEALAVVLKHGGKKAKLPESIPLALDAGKNISISHEDKGVRQAAAKVFGSSCELLDVDLANDVLSDMLFSEDYSHSSNIRHGKACCSQRIFSSSLGAKIHVSKHMSVLKLMKSYMFDEKNCVREASCEALGAILGSSSEPNESLNEAQSSLLKCLDPKEDMEILKSIARGLCIAVTLNAGLFDGSKGLPIVDAALKNAMSGNQRVQIAFQDFLWLTLQVQKGDDGLKRYMDLSMFDNAKTMKNLYSKVLVRIKSVDVDI